MRVLMTGGGTAGHVNPAIAIANTIKKHNNDAHIEFVASTSPTEKATDLVPRAGYKLHLLDVRGHYALWNPKNIKVLYLMLKSNRQARDLIEQFKPDVIIGTGGYASYPLLRAGADMGIPTLVHESNAAPGRAVRMLKRRVGCVMTNFESSIPKLKGARRAVCVGNPTLFDADKGSNLSTASDGYKQKVICFGGSRGALSINKEMCRILPRLAEDFPLVQFYIASGTRDYNFMIGEFKSRGLDKRKNVVLVDYIYDMKDRMKAADLVVCRAGAMTISELALMGKAAIFIPLPDSAGDHQYFNAKTICDGNGGEMVEEKRFENGDLEKTIRRLLGDDELRAKYEKNITKFAVLDANERIYSEILGQINEVRSK